jgi:hypothetical protein
MIWRCQKNLNFFNVDKNSSLLAGLVLPQIHDNPWHYLEKSLTFSLIGPTLTVIRDSQK